MRRILSLIEAIKQDRDTSTNWGVDPWAMMVLVLGGLLTFVWISFLLWAALRALEWAFG